MSQTFRTFTAIEIPEVLQHRVTQFTARYQGWDEYRWTPQHHLHITLNFLGDITQQEIASVCRHLEAQIAISEPFQVELAGMGAFPKPDRPRILWLGVAAGAKAITQIHDRVQNSLQSLGLDADRQKFSPHATLARLKKKRRFSPDVAAEIAQQSQRQFGSFDVSEIVIFESILERSGPRYQPLSRVKLQGPSGKPD